ncbi:GNAT family N-acetyltransferase [Actinacidiphila sp. ITFR-21]|uniref:GNAT family N-acetyltransferase n=1 Tax=Actinacidiphila sp. ITFR-21 TaxID=3075199 RepID=UPI00288B91C3|nr:GNAT family N-acetyltransferase [Streptomyces sp. ITFR-21]WNI16369.1 GNAT family N-acetyltransferase [Streptomyces sp. ITFR-21]
MTVVIEDAVSSPAVRPHSGQPASTLWSVAPAHPGDRPALADLFTACSPETIRLRFFGRLRAWPRDYLDGALAGPPEQHDSVVAYRSGRTHLLGMASLATPCDAGPDVGELGVLVADPWQRQGVGTAMLELLLTRARARGLERVAASVMPGRPRLLAALAQRLEADGALRARDGLTGIYKLTRRP